MCPRLTQHAYWCVCLSMWPPDCPHVAVFQPRAAAERRGRRRRCCWVSLGDSTHHSGFQQSRVHGRDCGGVKLSLTSLFTDSTSQEGDFPAAGIRAQKRHILHSALHICWNVNICGNAHNRKVSGRMLMRRIFLVTFSWELMYSGINLAGNGTTPIRTVKLWFL